MNFYKTNMQLPSIDNLFVEKDRQLNQIIGYLQAMDVRTDDQFQITVKSTKKTILLTPVTFGDPKISSHYQITKQVPANYQNMWGGAREVDNSGEIEPPFRTKLSHPVLILQC